MPMAPMKRTMDNLLDSLRGTLASLYCTHRTCRLTEIKPGMHSRISYRTELFEEIFRVLKMGYSLENLSYASSVFHHYLGSLRYLRSIGRLFQNTA